MFTIKYLVHILRCEPQKLRTDVLAKHLQTPHLFLLSMIYLCKQAVPSESDFQCGQELSFHPYVTTVMTQQAMTEQVSNRPFCSVGQLNDKVAYD